jgi:ribulose-phosphate 3-epimerase
LGKIAIYPSILSADFTRLAEEISLIEEGGADGIHLDVMDGHFVPNISFGPVIIRSIRKVTNLCLWAHLMIEEPGKYLKAFRDAGVDGIIVHPEIEEDLKTLADQIHDLDIQAGVALNPESGIGMIEEFLDRFERILVMTVHPGFGGQSFIPEPLEKITALKRRITPWPHPPLIGVDGGIDVNTAPQAVRAGADVLIAGSAIFRADNPVSALQHIRREAEKEL